MGMVNASVLALTNQGISMLITIRNVCSQALATLLLATLAHNVQALPLLTLTPLQTSIAASAGTSVLVTGSIINRTNADLDATDLFLNFSGFDPGALTPWQELGQVTFRIPSFSFRDNVALFTVEMAATALPGTQALDVFLQDVSGNFSDVVSFSFLVDQVAAVPEPATLALLLAGLPLLMRRRHSIDQGGHHG
jgi:hypothetical protein